MPVYIALLRAVNLPGYKPVAMADLRDLLADLGLENGRSLLQSGNLVFRSASRSTAQLEQRLEVETNKRLELETDYFVRSAAEWDDALSGNPFPKEAERDPAHLVVLCLKRAPSARAVGALRAAIKDREVVQARGKQAYIVYPDSIGQSRLTMHIIETALGTRATGRNWNTVRKLGAMANQLSG